MLETEKMVKNEYIQCVIHCPIWTYTNTVLITVQINIKGVLKGNLYLYKGIYIYINIYIYIYIYVYVYRYIYAIMKTICPPGYHHNGFVTTHALG